jgi:sugar phosphate isomerase/epimerase
MINKFKQTYGFNIFNQIPEKQFEYAAAHGLQHIEINLSQDNLSIDTFDEQRIKLLRDLAESHHIQISLHIPYFINISDILIHLRKSNIKYFLKTIQCAHELHATHITMHMGSFYWFPVEQWERKKALNRFLKYLEIVIKSSKGHMVNIALENVVPLPSGSDYYLLGDNIEDFKYIFSNINSEHIKFCLDTGHANMAEGVLEYTKNFHDQLTCIHYHDNNGLNDEHLPVGEGKVPWKDFVNELIHIGYEKPMISECRNLKAHESAALLEKFFIR